MLADIEVDSSSGNTPNSLENAIKQKNLEGLKKAIEEDPYICSTLPQSGKGALQLAIENNFFEGISILLKNEAQLSHQYFYNTDDTYYKQGKRNSYTLFDVLAKSVKEKTFLVSFKKLLDEDTDFKQLFLKQVKQDVELDLSNSQPNRANRDRSNVKIKLDIIRHCGLGKAFLELFVEATEEATEEVQEDNTHEKIAFSLIKKNNQELLELYKDTKSCDWPAFSKDHLKVALLNNCGESVSFLSKLDGFNGYLNKDDLAHMNHKNSQYRELFLAVCSNYIQDSSVSDDDKCEFLDKNKTFFISGFKKKWDERNNSFMINELTDFLIKKGADGKKPTLQKKLKAKLYNLKKDIQTED